MAKTYPLARLLRLRKMTEDQKASDLALTQRREFQAQEKVRRAQEEIIGSKIDGDYSEAVWRSTVAAQVARRSMMLEAVSLAEVAAEETATATLAWQEARRQSMPLEKLEERFNEQQALEENRAESIVLDEVAQNMKKQELGVQDGN